MWIIRRVQNAKTLLLFSRRLQLAGRLGRGEDLCGSFLKPFKRGFLGRHGHNYTKMQRGLQ